MTRVMVGPGELGYDYLCVGWECRGFRQQDEPSTVEQVAGEAVAQLEIRERWTSGMPARSRKRLRRASRCEGPSVLGGHVLQSRVRPLAADRKVDVRPRRPPRAPGPPGQLVAAQHLHTL